MPRTEDPHILRVLLNTDRPWAIYALGDLDPHRFHQCDWFHRNGSVVLLYRALETPVLFAFGAPHDIAVLVEEAGPPPAVHLHVKPEILPVIAAHYARVESGEVLRMVLREPRFTVRPDVRPLLATDVQELATLYKDGAGCAESPDFFFPSMLEDGTFFGVWDDNELVAAAGTHLVAPQERVAAIGNVYTRRDRRGRGLGATVTSAVVGNLIDRVSRLSPSVCGTQIYVRSGFMSELASFGTVASWMGLPPL